MRQWIETIFNNASAQVDFLSYMRELAENNLEMIYKAVLKDDIKEAKFLAHELQVYRTIAKTFKRETQEFQQQVAKENDDARTNY